MQPAGAIHIRQLHSDVALRPKMRTFHQSKLLRQLANISEPLAWSAYTPILLQKSFWGGERKFLEPLVRFPRGDVRDHIVSSKIDHGDSNS